jgi:hypothetical protein
VYLPGKQPRLVSKPRTEFFLPFIYKRHDGWSWLMSAAQMNRQVPTPTSRKL